MKVSLRRVNEKYHFEGRGKSGVPVHLDNATDEPSKGASPMELLLMGVGGCSAIDIIAILTKQRQQVDRYDVEVEGSRDEVRGAKPFKAIHVKVILEGTIDPKKAWRAAELSFEKYCSVSITLEGAVDVTYEVEVNGEKVTG